MDLQLLLKAYKQIKEAQKKQKALDKMSAADINYAIIRDLINSAQYGVTITVSFRDGSRMDIKRDDNFDRLQKKYVEGF